MTCKEQVREYKVRKAGSKSGMGGIRCEMSGLKVVKSPHNENIYPNPKAAVPQLA